MFVSAASSTLGSCYIMSSVATKTVEEIRTAEKSGLKWFQVRH